MKSYPTLLERRYLKTFRCHLLIIVQTKKMKEKSDQTPGRTPSLLTEGGREGTVETVSILRDLDPRSARLEVSSQPRNMFVIPVAVFLLIVGGALYGAYSSSELSDEPVRVASVPERSPPGGAPEAVVAASQPVPQESKPTEQVADAQPSAGNATGSALIVTSPKTVTEEQHHESGNPLVALAESTNDAPPVAPSVPVKHKPIKTSAKVSKHSRRQSHSVAQAGKAGKPGASTKAGNSSDRQPGKAEEPVSPRDVDIITAIVKDK
jgi:hypothetical protein